MNTKNLDNYIDQLVVDKGFDLGNVDLVKRVKDELYDLVEDAINSEIVNKLSQDKISEFEKLFNNNVSDEVVVSFLKSNIENLDQVIESVLLNFRNIYLDNN